MVRRTLHTTPPFLSQNPPLFLSPPTTTNSPSSNDDNNTSNPGILITVLILAIAVILSASLYLLLRFLRRHNHRTPPPPPPQPSQSLSKATPSPINPLIDSLPLFTYDSLSSKPTHSSGDCAVCLSKFEPKDSLRLLPICCHAFHAECIDTWLATNQSCPLCRSPIFLSDDHLHKFSLLHRGNSLSSSGSFRVEIGNVSRRGNGNVSVSGEIRRSYSIGDAFDYVVPNDAVSEVPYGSFRIPADFKLDSQQQPTATMEVDNLAAEIGPRGGAGWLKDYLSHSLSSSRTTSFRGSGRWFFTGTSRRTTELTQNRETELGLEASQFSDEIGELFRWLSSGV